MKLWKFTGYVDGKILYIAIDKILACMPGSTGIAMEIQVGHLAFRVVHDPVFLSIFEYINIQQ